MNQEEITDHELYLAVKNRDESAFKVLYERYWSVLYCYARKFVADQCDAEDIVQEVFVVLWKNAPKLILRQSLGGYLYGCTKFKVFDFLDKQTVRLNHTQSIIGYMEQYQNNTEQELLEKELAVLIESTIASLPTKMREVFILKKESELSHSEIAKQLNLSPETVKKQVYNATKTLRLKLNHLLSLII